MKLRNKQLAPARKKNIPHAPQGVPTLRVREGSAAKGKSRRRISGGHSPSIGVSFPGQRGVEEAIQTYSSSNWNPFTELHRVPPCKVKIDTCEEDVQEGSETFYAKS